MIVNPYRTASKRFVTSLFIGLALMTTASLAWAQPASSPPAEAPIDFSKQIQPILAKRCYACHGPDKAEGGLRLTLKEVALKKLESGTHAIVPKDPTKSEVIKRVTSTDHADRMPPEGAPLTEQQIALLRKWIEQGAEWNEHWAFLPPKAVRPPTVKNQSWVANPIDAFILRKLEQNGFAPAPALNKTSLLRRVTYDLTGLPPTAEELAAFQADQSPNAYEKVVDRLLRSSQFGEHWARHWLDVVRYADTNSFERDGPKPNAWRYRDYVIRAFNDDKPYDRFIREQLAGDELADGGTDGLIATGFYRLGLWDDEPADRLLARYDGLDDIITTTAQGFLGLTVNCARCHDHKIDPIPQADYYSLLSFFEGITPNGNPNPNVERPIFETPTAKQDYDRALQAHQEKLNGLQNQVTAIENRFRDLLYKQDQELENPDLDDVESRFYRDSWQKLPDFDALKPETVAKLERPFFDISPATREFSFGFVFIGTLKVPADGEYTFTVDSDDGSRLFLDGKQLILYDGIHGTGKPETVTVTLKQGRLPIRVDYFQGPSGAKDLIVKWSGPGFQSRFLSAPPEGTLKAADRKGKRKDLAELMRSQGGTILGKDRYQEYLQLTKSLEGLKQNKPAANYALCVTENGSKPPETFVMKRGNPQSPGEKVVPAFLSVLGGGTAKITPPASQGNTSGRRTALANWIASPENRLTSRVMVNRLWQHHFGRGIVRSPNNVGLLGDRPTHPELLDWLAGRLVEEGWRLKPLHKLMVMSNAYQMSSQANPAALAKDPLNNLFWRHDMRRLNAEELRDTILFVTGDLNPKMYGPGVFPEISDEVKAGQSIPGQGWNTSSPQEQVRRSVYVQVKRSLTLPILSDFDFPDTDSSCSARFATTQPTQALGMLNGKFTNEAATHLAKRLRKEAGENVTRQVELAYRLTLNRDPDPAAIQRGLKLIDTLQKKHELNAEKSLDQFCLMVLNLNEFIYLD